jgi:hypothetical protein
METKQQKGTKTKSKIVTEKKPKTEPKKEPTAQELALAELDRAVDPLIRSWKQATREHEQAKADRLEAAYNRALDAATAKYERWCKAHGVEP